MPPVFAIKNWRRRRPGNEARKICVDITDTVAHNTCWLCLLPDTCHHYFITCVMCTESGSVARHVRTMTQGILSL